ncbi:putative quinol monooxygenase [Nocardioides bruguierae]|uniref:Antibiotic biosynthesis monooxygenase n=1 Tax=Nocardioides bruguierae TaxID=2945102 RepID=A0A9X2IFP7_9ACTN|nr:antibiotic biosynthesis monooxygenase [Nocardioides bruguierae]MCM0622056.1 antibiotic biosynthesis monooxygenase [Nocardioides bruguierae]
MTDTRPADAENVVLRGTLTAPDAQVATLVETHMPRHVELSLAEPGCLHFEVTPAAAPLTWELSERFVDTAAFRAHQARGAASEWATVSALLSEDFRITGLTD